MLRLKGCPRCNGDMYFQVDLDGYWWSCLQCGNAVEEQSHGKLVAVPILVEAGGDRTAGGRRAA